MIFSDRTLEILKNFSDINQSTVFDEGNVLRSISPSKTIFAKAEIQEHIDEEFAIYNMPRFLNTMSLLGKPEIRVKDSNVILLSEGKKVTYAIASRDTIVVPPSKDIEIKEPVVKFSLSQKNLESVMKAKAILSLPEIVFVGEDGKVKVRTTDVGNPTSDFYDVEVGETNADFFISYKGENFKFLPLDYEVEVASSLVTRFTAKDVVYWIAAQSNSVIPGSKV